MAVGDYRWTPNRRHVMLMCHVASVPPGGKAFHAEFLVDTGGSKTSLTKQLLTDVGAKFYKEEEAEAGAGSIKIWKRCFTDLVIGIPVSPLPIAFHLARLANVQPVPAEFTFASGYDVWLGKTNILGADVLSGLGLQVAFDYAHDGFYLGC